MDKLIQMMKTFGRSLNDFCPIVVVFLSPHMKLNEKILADKINKFAGVWRLTTILLVHEVCCTLFLITVAACLLLWCWLKL